MTLESNSAQASGLSGSPPSLLDVPLVPHFSHVESDEQLLKWIEQQRAPLILAVHNQLPMSFRRRLLSDVVATKKILEVEPSFTQEGLFIVTLSLRNFLKGLLKT